MMCLAIGLILLAGGVALGEGGPIRVDACRLMNDPYAYAGKLIEVEGFYVLDIHDSGLGIRCCEGPVLDGKRWPGWMCLAGSSSPLWVKPVQFQTDAESYRRLEAFYRDLKLSGSKAEVVATVVGEVQMRESYRNAREMNGAPAQVGYCFLGRAPLLLVIKEVKAFRKIEGGLDCRVAKQGGGKQ